MVAEIPDAQKAISFRNILIHGYAVIDDVVVWDTLQQHLPGLRGRVQVLLERDERRD